jgi:ribose transport system permease protein
MKHALLGMKNLLALAVLLLLLYGALISLGGGAGSAYNHQKIAREIGQLGIIALGAGLVIIAGGIDLSVGLVYGLAAVCFPLLLENNFSPLAAAAIVLAGAAMLGSIHGLFITKLHLQPFLVTLCAAMIYRGVTRWLSWREGGAGSRVMTIAGMDLGELSLFKGTLFEVPTPFLLLLAIAAVAAVFLHATAFGRYIYAIGSNEQAARFAGVATDWYRILAYLICALLGGVGGLLHIIDVGGVTPSNVGEKQELFAITAAVLGGCSLRGGQGTVCGILLGAATLRLLDSYCFFSGLSNDLYSTVVGVALLVAISLDELLRWGGASRR